MSPRPSQSTRRGRRPGIRDCARHFDSLYPADLLRRGLRPRPGRARSSAGEHSLDMGGVTGSIPVVPTIYWSNSGFSRLMGLVGSSRSMGTAPFNIRYYPSVGAFGLTNARWPLAARRVVASSPIRRFPDGWTRSCPPHRRERDGSSALTTEDFADRSRAKSVFSLRLEPACPASGSRIGRRKRGWWSQTESNRRPLQCH